jgi:pimeloyl-ACP methyl ester carboxylesterase
MAFMIRPNNLGIYRLAALGVVALAIPGPASALFGADALPPAAVYRDPPKDAAHPARMESLQIMSHGCAMNAVFYLAGGAERRPTVLFLHGSPGNEQNLDLAQAIRRAGWNVLTLHYRGSWGSAGQYSLLHCVEDSQVAIAFLRDPAVAARYGLAPGKIVVAGHSLGAFLAAKAGAADSALMGVALIAAWDVGFDGPLMAKWTKEQIEDEFGDMPGRVVGATGPSMIAEALKHRDDWALAAFAPGLAQLPVLVVTPHDDDRVTDLKLAGDLKALGGPVTTVDIDTDHPFSDSRIALETAVILWLQSLPGAPKA